MVIFRYKIPILGKTINLHLEDYSDGCSVVKLLKRGIAMEREAYGFQWWKLSMLVCDAVGAFTRLEGLMLLECDNS